MSATAYIYALSDPEKPMIPRYIGRTQHHPKARFYEHMLSAFKPVVGKGKYRRCTVEMSAWLMGLDSLGKLPCLIIYEVTTIERAPEREKYWTQFFRPFGLFNQKDGDSHGSSSSIVERRRKWMETPAGEKWRASVKGQHTAKQPSLLLWGHRQHFKALRTAGARKKMKPIQCVETGRVFESKMQAARFIGKSTQALTDCAKHGWKCGGYHWKILENNLTEKV